MRMFILGVISWVMMMVYRKLDNDGKSTNPNWKKKLNPILITIGCGAALWLTVIGLLTILNTM